MQMPSIVTKQLMRAASELWFGFWKCPAVGLRKLATLTLYYMRSVFKRWSQFTFDLKPYTSITEVDLCCSFICPLLSCSAAACEPRHPFLAQTLWAILPEGPPPEGQQHKTTRCTQFKASGWAGRGGGIPSGSFVQFNGCWYKGSPEPFCLTTRPLNMLLGFTFLCFIRQSGESISQLFSLLLRTYWMCVWLHCHALHVWILSGGVVVVHIHNNKHLYMCTGHRCGKSELNYGSNLKRFNNLIITLQHWNGGNTKSARLIMKQRLWSCDGNPQRAEQWHAPDVQAHCVGSAQTTTTWKQKQKSQWNVSLKLW